MQEKIPRLNGLIPRFEGFESGRPTSSRESANLDCGGRAKRRHRFSEAGLLPNAIGHSLAPSPADDRHDSLPTHSARVSPMTILPPANFTGSVRTTHFPITKNVEELYFPAVFPCSRMDFSNSLAWRMASALCSAVITACGPAKPGSRPSKTIK